ncbi:MAG: preprotein translocase subunit SecE [Thermodesulfobacteriota bacterium]
MDKIKQFLREAKQELKKVTWPPRKHAVASTSVVLVLVILISFFLGLMDTLLAKIVGSFLT